MAATALAGGVWWLRRRYLIVIVVGRSMLPGYADGDRVLVRRRRQARVGDVVVADLPYRLDDWVGGNAPTPREARSGVFRASEPSAYPMFDRVVKRVAAGPGDPVPPGIAVLDVRVPANRFVLVGDNTAESADSRQYGYVPADQLVGVVLRHLR